MVPKWMAGFCWGVFLLASEWMICTKAHLPPNLENSISKLKAHYIKNYKEVFDGHPLFTRAFKNLMENLETSEQKLLMSIVLDTYSRIFTRMQNDSLDKDTRDSLLHVQEHLKNLQKNYFSEKSAELKKYAENLWAIQESDQLVQKKAVFELTSVYTQATHLKNKDNNDRKKRQIKGRSKKRFG